MERAEHAQGGGQQTHDERKSQIASMTCPEAAAVSSLYSAATVVPSLYIAATVGSSLYSAATVSLVPA